MQEELRSTRMRIVVNRIQSSGVKRARPPYNAVHLVSFRQQQFRQIRAVLPGDAGDERFLRHALLDKRFEKFTRDGKSGKSGTRKLAEQRRRHTMRRDNM